MNSDLIQGGLLRSAIAYAYAAHSAVGQTRKYTGEPYIVHPTAVAGLVGMVTSDEVTLAAAFLHDTVEDTKVENSDIISIFGEDVASLVWWLTDVSKLTDGPRKLRKELDRQHIAKADPRAKTIKLADLIDNTRSIVRYDKKFAKTYLKEKELLLEVLKEGDSALYCLAVASLNEAKVLINKESNL